MNKGQLSLDFMLAIIAFIIFTGILGIMITDIQKTQKDFMIRSQLKEIGTNLSEIIISTNSLNDSFEKEGFEIKYQIPLIKDPSKSNPQTCEQIIFSNTHNQTTGTISYEGINITFFIQKNFNRLLIQNIDKITCGSILHIYKEEKA